ncbi:hypothetical protein PCE1_000101 [Barthelona sp. PCE]
MRFDLSLLNANDFVVNQFEGGLFVPQMNNRASIDDSQIKGVFFCCALGLIYEPRNQNYPMLKYSWKNTKISLIECAISADRSKRVTLLKMEVDHEVCLLKNGIFAPFNTNNAGAKAITRLFYFGKSARQVFTLFNELIHTNETFGSVITENSNYLALLSKTYQSLKITSSVFNSFREKILFNANVAIKSPNTRQIASVTLTDSCMYINPSCKLHRTGVLAFPLNTVLFGISFENVTNFTLELFFTDPQLSHPCYKADELLHLEKKQRYVDMFEYSFMWNCLSIRIEFVAKESLYKFEDLISPWYQRQVDLNDVQNKWTNGDMSNFDYLMCLNYLSGRSLMCIERYPVLPWVLCDYTSEILDFDNPAVYRDLTKPIGALESDRLDSLRMRHNTMEDMIDESNTGLSELLCFGQIVTSDSATTSASTSNAESSSFFDDFDMIMPPLKSASVLEGETDVSIINRDYRSYDPLQRLSMVPFLYGSHYSTTGYTTYFLLRQHPLWSLILGGGRYDLPDRLFSSIPMAWENCQSSNTDVRELTPEFYSCPRSADKWLGLNDSIIIGRTQANESVGDVELPPWAHSPKDFVKKMRYALETDYVRNQLGKWIDLIFGVYRDPRNALQKDNLFHPLSYEENFASMMQEYAVLLDRFIGDIGITDRLSSSREAALTQMKEFGVCPRQLFYDNHP